MVISCLSFLDSHADGETEILEVALSFRVERGDSQKYWVGETTDPTLNFWLVGGLVGWLVVATLSTPPPSPPLPVLIPVMHTYVL